MPGPREKNVLSTPTHAGKLRSEVQVKGIHVILRLGADKSNLELGKTWHGDIRAAMIPMGVV